MKHDPERPSISRRVKLAGGSLLLAAGGAGAALALGGGAAAASPAVLTSTQPSVIQNAVPLAQTTDPAGGPNDQSGVQSGPDVQSGAQNGPNDQSTAGGPDAPEAPTSAESDGAAG